MQSNNVILQVANETAEVMEQISEQLFDDTDARFDEVLQAMSSTTKEKLDKLSDIEKSIQTNRANIGDISDLLKRYSNFFEQISESVKTSLENDEKILTKEEKYIELVRDMSEQNRSNEKILEEKIDNILDCLNKLSEQQLDIYKKQNDLENDIKYLKLPFFKRWFSKG